MPNTRKRPAWSKKRKKKLINTIIYIFAVIGLVSVIVFTAKGIYNLVNKKKVVSQGPELDVQLLTVSPYNRPGIAIDQVKGIVVHYTANPGSTAKQNRDYFEGLSTSHKTKASAHFIIGLDGEVVQCIPTGEMAYASNDRNSDTIAIECCHPDSSGQFNQATYDTLVLTVAWLCGKFNLTTDDVIRHYDVTGKSCPKYYVDNPEQWQQFLKDVDDYIDRYGQEVSD